MKSHLDIRVERPGGNTRLQITCFASVLPPNDSIRTGPSWFLVLASPETAVWAGGGSQATQPSGQCLRTTVAACVPAPGSCQVCVLFTPGPLSRFLLHSFGPEPLPWLCCFLAIVCLMSWNQIISEWIEVREAWVLGPASVLISVRRPFSSCALVFSSVK